MRDLKNLFITEHSWSLIVKLNVEPECPSIQTDMWPRWVVVVVCGNNDNQTFVKCSPGWLWGWLGPDQGFEQGESGSQRRGRSGRKRNIKGNPLRGCLWISQSENQSAVKSVLCFKFLVKTELKQKHESSLTVNQNILLLNKVIIRWWTKWQLG